MQPASALDSTVVRGDKKFLRQRERRWEAAAFGNGPLRLGFEFARVCRRPLNSRVRGFRCVCSVVLMTTGAILLLVDLGGCAKHRLPGGLSKLKPCRLPGVDDELFCGKLTVFENRQTRSGRTIDLNVVVLPAFDQKTKTEPLFDLAGRPGGASTDGAGLYA